MTAYGTVETAVQAMREGAYDFVEKPLKRMTIVKSVRKAAERQSLVEENRSLQARDQAAHAARDRRDEPGARAACSTSRRRPRRRTATVLVLGESGTGKELLARYIHERSARARGPFVAVNCAAIPETILESRALRPRARRVHRAPSRRREGRFAKASRRHAVPRRDRRALAVGAGEAAARAPGGRVRAASAATPCKADVRIVAATNRDLRAEVAAGRFREDLFYRLNVIAVTAPPLRARREDIPLLVDHFLGLYCAEEQPAAARRVARAVLERLIDYAWPGNVRELENVIERAVVLCRGDTLDRSTICPRRCVQASAAPRRARSRSPSARRSTRSSAASSARRCGTRRATSPLAAQLLGISTRTIYRKLGEPRRRARTAGELRRDRVGGYPGRSRSLSRREGSGRAARQNGGTGCVRLLLNPLQIQC